ncbi:hypothetical protein GCM10009841_12620 [Microlunatus panaciterrae]|uniref:DUF3618 domain-containing protein n=1 Tax=Microlunatus panaciterrae TaxID=400768 RepID=A0ABS2RLE1_9ACTN|nr:hypothetical protein [Microlunatus panaciterrae]
MAPSDPSPKGPARTQQQIEADMAAARERLTASVETLIDRVHPQRIKQRQIANVKQLAHTELENAKAQVVDENGLRTGRLVILGAAVAGFVTFVLIIRKIRSGGKKKD